MIFGYTGYRGIQGRCALTHHRLAGAYDLVIVSEVHGGYQFPGIRDSAEELATQVCGHFRIHPGRLVWVERHEEDWRVVTFGWDWERRMFSLPMRWPTTREAVESLRVLDSGPEVARWVDVVKSPAEPALPLALVGA